MKISRHARPRARSLLLALVGVVSVLSVVPSSGAVAQQGSGPEAVGGPVLTEPSASSGRSGVATPAWFGSRTYEGGPAWMNSESSGGGGPQWHTSMVQAGTTQNCLNGYSEPLGLTWSGWYGELGVTPKVNDVYYTSIGWGVTGYPCGGGAYVHAERFLPANTQLAISSQNPVICYYKSISKENFERFTQGCPQQPQGGMQGGHSFDPSDNSGAWPTASTAAYEILIPVKTTAKLSATGGNPCNDCMTAGVWVIDGYSSPWSYPSIPTYVEGPPSPPSVSYPVPSISNETCCRTDGAAEADLTSWIFTQGSPGPTQLQVSETKGAPYEYNFDYTITSSNIQQWGHNIELKWRLFFEPDTKYYWRMCFTPNSTGTRVCGGEQSFEVDGPPDTTPPDTSIVDKPKKITKKRTASFSFKSTDQGSTYQCKLDSGAFEPCVAPVYEKLKEGKHTLQVQAKNDNGLLDPTPAKYTWKVDLTKPQTTITSSPASKTTKRGAKFEFKASEKSTFQCKLDSSKWKSCSSPKSYSGLSRKQHTFSVRAKDRAGNVDGSPASKTWTIKR